MSAAPQFRLNTEGRDPASISRTQAEAITETLYALFGTPDRPVVPEGIALQAKRIEVAAGPIGGDAGGNQWGLFRRHCAACHGAAGDGAGPPAHGSWRGPSPASGRMSWRIPAPQTEGVR